MRLSRFTEFGRKIICVGRNYRDHAIELGNEVPEKPLLFMKPPTAYVTEGNPIKIPRGCQELHHEVELGVVVGRRARDLNPDTALDVVGGYALALDMTARDVQRESQRRGLPWETAKGFDTACPVSAFMPREAVADPQALTLWCKVNGVERQRGSTSDMLFGVAAVLSHASGLFTLEPGDLVLTGTPKGVGPVQEGDVIEAGIEGLITMSFRVERQV
ncbi:fumarylacetoacetate hydrolase, putative [Ixodes scapularis]|uniref:Oxaloacetate tautomerase FAHD1, mitochondrial n=1 Tax=Ixodes scapularis TaxID=6945 RepID=B7PMI7_IXOSC|nr:fumarylacetoacetate hydrolase, putative [Ixodes scapularis]|eukprot:XP_002434985.1 fumarylacetoacetate hydrolase, putative [Ixodes scapularis]